MKTTHALVLTCSLFLTAKPTESVNRLEKYRTHAEEFNINPQNEHFLEQAWSVNTGGRSCPQYYSITVNKRLFKGNRPWEARWDLIKDIIDYEGKNVAELGCCMGLVATSLKKYRGVNRAVGVDGTDAFLTKQGSPYRIRAARWFAQAFDADVQFIQADLDNDLNYETRIGYDYDVVFCMSLLHWVQDKERLLRYLSHFDHIIFEGHDAPSVEIERFKKHGFDNHTILGIGDHQGKTIIHFYK